MSNLKHLIALIFLLMGSVLTFGQTLTITPAAPATTYVPNSTKDFTFTLSGIPDLPCQGDWTLTASSSSNNVGFSGETFSMQTITVDGTGTGSLVLTFNTPSTGNLIIEATAVQPGGCTVYPDGIEADGVSISASIVISDFPCDVEYFEGFELVAAGTGLSGTSPPASEPVGQGTAYLQASGFSTNSYFSVQNIPSGGKRMEARNVDGVVRWESNDITLSPCCARNFSVDIFGENGESEDFVRVFYSIDGGSEMLIEQQNGTFATTVSFSTCGIAPVSGTSNFKFIIEVFNNSTSDRHGFDNVRAAQGFLVEEPGVGNIDCSSEGGGTSSITVDAVSACSPEFSIDGGANWQSSNVFTGIAVDATYIVLIRDQVFTECGTSQNEVVIDLAGNCTYVFPVELLDFYGRAEADAIGLYWTTATELDNDYMAVERSRNGVDFEEIGRVQGHGTTTEIQKYAFADNYPMQGINYYRLRQVDYDGTVEYHPIISVMFDRPLDFSVRISPNPVYETLQVNWSFPGDQEGFLRVFDLQGKMMSQRAVGGGSGHYNLPVQDLPAGLYLLQMEQNGQKKWLRFVKD